MAAQSLGSTEGMLSKLGPGGLTGNGVIGIRREDKNVWEGRCPLTPAQVKLLLHRSIVKKVIVQPSSVRCYRDQEFADAGAEINEDLSGASTILAVKEVPAHLLIPERTYLFFSHTIKAQPYNMPLLDTILEKKIRMIDYERIVGQEGRLVKFGPYAGYAGMIDTLYGLGKALLVARGCATPFLTVSQSCEYRSLETARRDLISLGDDLRKYGIPRELGPLTVAVCGTGAVSGAAQEILHHLPCKYVTVDELPVLHKQKTFNNKVLYILVVSEREMVERKDRKPFNRQEYYKKPHLYQSVFARDIAPYAHVMINAIYWEEKYPRLLTNEQCRKLKEENRFPLLVLGDITCDINGSVEMLVKSTSIQNPFFVYRTEHDDTIGLEDYVGEGVLILGVDHLPAEFSKESSTDFGTGLVPLVEKVCVSNGLASLEDQKNQLGDAVFAGQITDQGKLTPHFQYIAELRKINEANAKAQGTKPRLQLTQQQQIEELKKQIVQMKTAARIKNAELKRLASKL